MPQKDITLEQLWKSKGFEPNENQKKAINHINGPLLLTSGPGSGKTRVLLWRTLNLIVCHHIEPRDIFLSTFTEKAALQLKDGLRNLLGLATNATGKPYDISKMAVGTVHSICQQILTDRRFSPDHGRLRAPVMIDELDQYFMIFDRGYWNEMLTQSGFSNSEKAAEDITEHLSGQASKSRHKAVLAVVGLFNRFSEECLNPETVRTTDTILKKLIAMYGFYKKTLTDDAVKQTDLSLLQQSAYDTISAFKDSGNVFKHIIIDEYQDTNTIQEKIFFALAKGNKNICVVGDDDQALYRFRGATVENLVEFEERCEGFLGIKPMRIDLNTNYRSRKHVVNLYTDFISIPDWKRPKGKGYYRIHDKKIAAHSKDSSPAIITTNKADKEVVCEEIGKFILSLQREKKITDLNQCAILFPAMKESTRVTAFMEAFDNLGLPYYAPRAGRFLDLQESKEMWGLFLKVFGKPDIDEDYVQYMKEYDDWLKECVACANKLIKVDKKLSAYVSERNENVATVVKDYELLAGVAKRKKYNLDAPFEDSMKREFADAAGISAKAKKNLTNSFFFRALQQRRNDGRPASIKYVINRAASLDWSILDLFYQLTGFDHFAEMFHRAEKANDEGPVCNLGLMSQYIGRFTERHGTVLTGSFLESNKFGSTFFLSYTYSLYRRGESEYEDADDPFPKGRVPFITIHQAKGLEFPVVILGSLYKKEHGADVKEEIIRDLLKKKGEPLDKISLFDNMRMFYVALSRAKNLLVFPQAKHWPVSAEFKTLLEKHEDNIPLLTDYKIAALPAAKEEISDLGKSYSYTGDYLSYKNCPRQYMVFRKYGFVPSRSQTMFFGSLVHETIEDLHHLLIRERKQGAAQ